MALARSRPMYSFLHARARTTFAPTFSTSARWQRTLGGSTEGPPPDNFRLNQTKIRKPKEGLWDEAGRYFLLMEMMRGMWVLLEQFFRPP